MNILPKLLKKQREQRFSTTSTKRGPLDVAASPLISHTSHVKHPSAARSAALERAAFGDQRCGIFTDSLKRSFDRISSLRPTLRPSSSLTSVQRQLSMAYKGTGMSAAGTTPPEGPGSTDSGAAAAASGSCVDAFDALWFCYSPAHQVAARTSSCHNFFRCSPLSFLRLPKPSHTLQFTHYYRTGLPDQCIST